MEQTKATVEELRQILNSPEEDFTVVVRPDGSVDAIKRPKILTIGEALGDDY